MAIPFQQKFNDADDVVKLALIGIGLYIAYSIYQAVVNAGQDPEGTGSGIANAANQFLIGLGVSPDPNDTVGDPNSVGDTSSAAYAGNGLLGTLGNVTNKASGGILQSIGTWLGGAAATATGN